MSTIDQRGGRVDYQVVPSIGCTITLRFKDSSDDSDVDITGQTIEVTLTDLECDSKRPKTTVYAGEITSAAEGKAKIEIPSSYYTNLYGETVTYSVSRTQNGTEYPVVWGYHNMIEAV